MVSDVLECFSSINISTLCKWRLGVRNMSMKREITKPCCKNYRQECFCFTFTELPTSSSFWSSIRNPELETESCLSDFEGDVCNNTRKRRNYKSEKDREKWNSTHSIWWQWKGLTFFNSFHAPKWLSRLRN